jgi:uncharacterized protein with PIN domain
MAVMSGNDQLTATFRFFGNAGDFLARYRREGAFAHYFRGTPSIKDRIETLGTPHTEVAHIRIDGEFCSFRHLLSGGEYVEVFSSDYPPENRPTTPPLNAPPPGRPCFVADVNLGRLARLLRLLGFDTLYRNDYNDAHVAGLSAREDRVVLTRDRRLLMRRDVTYGYFVRTDLPELQAQEVMQRFRLHDFTRPFHRCSRCNGIVHRVEKAAVFDRLESKTKRYYDDFWQCSDCGQVYWEGSHIKGLTTLVAHLEAAPAQPVGPNS